MGGKKHSLPTTTDSKCGKCWRANDLTFLQQLFPIVSDLSWVKLEINWVIGTFSNELLKKLRCWMFADSVDVFFASD